MQEKTLLYIISCCCLMLLSACEHEIDFDYPVTEPKVIFDGCVSNEGVCVRISETRPVTDSTGSHVISDAQVWIASDDGVMEQLYYDAAGQRYLSSTGLVGEVGHTYTMRAKVGDREFEGSSTMMPPAPVDTIFFRWVDVINERIYFVCIKGRDAFPDERNYYLCKLWRGDELFRWNPRSGRSSVEGKYEFDVICSSEKDIDKGIDDEGRIPLRDGDVINAELMSVDRDSWEYFQSLLWGQTTTANAITNIRGGAQGIFMAANIIRPAPLVFNRDSLLTTSKEDP